MTPSSLDVRRVLVVDDDPDLRAVMTLALRDEGYEVRSVANGSEALGLLNTWRPHVILLDLMMPELDGWEFRTRQLATPAVADVPVVVLSAARDMRMDRLQPDAVVPKPFELEMLLDTVATIIR